MANYSLISDAQKKLVEEVCENASEEQREALTMFGAQMYCDGWMEWGGKFFTVGAILGAASVAIPLIVYKVKKHRDSKSVSKEES